MTSLFHSTDSNSSATPTATQPAPSATRNLGRRLGRCLGRRLTSAALLTCALAFVVQQVVIGEVIVPLAILSAILLATALLTFARKPWTPLVGVAVLIALALIYLAFTPYGVYHLTHPQNAVFFIIGIVTLSAVLIGVVSGLAATWHNYVPESVHAPTWLPATFSALICVVLIALLYTRVTDAGVSATSSAPAVAAATEASASMPEVQMSPFGFEKASVTVPVNGMVHLVENGSYYHVIANGRWVDGQAMREVEPGAPKVEEVKTNGEPIMIGPFTQTGTFHYLCPIHPNMNLTVVVQ